MSALPDGPAPRWRPWTDREDRLLRRHYRSDDSAALDALAAVLGRTRDSLKGRAARLGLRAPKSPRWTKDEEWTLLDLWGRLPDAAVARRLGRSVVACDVKAGRLRRRKRMGLAGWTARQVAAAFGVDVHKVTRQWIGQGWLAATRAAYAVGRHRPWVVGEPALLAFLRTYPHEYDWRRMDDPSGYYRKVAEAAWRADPLLTTAEVAARWGMTASGVHRHIAMGWLPAIRSHTNGNAGAWLVREADLAGRGPRRPELVGHAGRAR